MTKTTKISKNPNLDSKMKKKEKTEKGYLLDSDFGLTSQTTLEEQKTLRVPLTPTPETLPLEEPIRVPRIPIFSTETSSSSSSTMPVLSSSQKMLMVIPSKKLVPIKKTKQPLIKKREVEPALATMKVEVNKETKEVVIALAEKYGISRAKLCGMWMDLIDPNDKILIEKVTNIKVTNEVRILSTTRNALMSKLFRKGVIQDIAELDSRDLERILTKIKERRKAIKERESNKEVIK